MGLWTNRLFKFEFWVAPPKKVHWVLWGFLRDSMRTAFLAGVLVGATEVSKKSQAFASRNTGRFRSLDVLYLFVPMTFLRDGSSYDPSKIVKFSCKWPVDGLREKVETWRGSEYYWWNKSHIFFLQFFIRARWCRISSINDIMSMYVTFSHWISLTRWCEGEKSVASSLGTKMWVDKESRNKFGSIS